MKKVTGGVKEEDRWLLSLSNLAGRASALGQTCHGSVLPQARPPLFILFSSQLVCIVYYIVSLFKDMYQVLN